jgi:carboxyl-terminal processing protease
VFEELDKDRSIYENVTANDFVANFIVSDDVVVKFQNFVNFKERSNITFVAYHDQIKRLIKSELAQQLYGSTIAEKIKNETDDMIEEVILLSKGDNYFEVDLSEDN